MFEQITIIAPGLLGASIGMAAHERSLAKKINVWARRSEARKQCESLSWCYSAPENLEESVKESDLVVLCAPVEIIPTLVETIAPLLKNGCIITDVGSTKKTLCDAAVKNTPKGITFVGSHPMAGSEKCGLENAQADLFINRTCFVTPRGNEDKEIVNQVIAFWEALGMQCSCVSPETHDAIAAHISHLPHLMASILCSYLQQKDDQWKGFVGTGLLDTTRIASGSPDIWDSIVRQNVVEIENSLLGFQKELSLLVESVKDRDFELIRSFLEKGKEFRDDL